VANSSVFERTGRLQIFQLQKCVNLAAQVRAYAVQERRLNKERYSGHREGRRRQCALLIAWKYSWLYHSPSETATERVTRQSTAQLGCTKENTKQTRYNAFRRIDRVSSKLMRSVQAEFHFPQCSTLSSCTHPNYIVTVPMICCKLACAGGLKLPSSSNMALNSFVVGMRALTLSDTKGMRPASTPAQAATVPYRDAHR
jgi:hypothetical protein